jgi:hypothetical protein
VQDGQHSAEGSGQRLREEQREESYAVIKELGKGQRRKLGKAKGRGYGKAESRGQEQGQKDCRAEGRHKVGQRNGRQRAGQDRTGFGVRYG